MNIITTALAFFEYLITLFLLVMVILYVPLSIFRAITGDAIVRRKSLVALLVTGVAAILIWVIPNGDWHWSLQFGLLAVLCFVALNFHAALRLQQDCPLPNFDRHLLIATIVMLAVGFMIPDLGIKGTMALVSGFVLGG